MRMSFVNKKNRNQSGFVLITVLAITEIFLAITLGTLGFVLMQYKLNLNKTSTVQALHIAEAGVDYYRWVLYHAPQEYCNHETCKPGPTYGPYGPYAYKDFDGTITGYYKLYITPPLINGSTIVNIKSVGWEVSRPAVTRTIEVRCGIPSWSSYSTLADDNMRFGEGTEIWGPVFSNQGIRFDGIAAHNTVTSAQTTYDDLDHCEVALRWTGSAWVCDYSINEFGVHTHRFPVGSFIVDENFRANESAPNTVPTTIRNDVFLAGRSVGATPIAFGLLNSYADSMIALATSSCGATNCGLLFDPRATADVGSEVAFRNCIGSTCDEGYHITFFVVGTTTKFNIKRVSAVQAQTGCGSSYSIQTEDAGTNYNIPPNGIIFVENNIWVDGNINNARATIVAFTRNFANNNNTDIIVNHNLMYSTTTGADAIGLIAQRNITVGQYSDNNLEIDAALIAKSGRIGRGYYASTTPCTNWSRNSITVRGSLATAKRYGFAYVDGTGYITRNLIYDGNFTFSPPPHFPTTGEYTFISWREN
jgi:hypothetical protein